MKKVSSYKRGYKDGKDRVWGLIMLVIIITSFLAVFFLFMISLYPNEPEFEIYKEMCWNESRITDWYYLDSYDEFLSWDFKKYMVEEMKVRPRNFNGWDYFETLCYELLGDYGVERPFEVISFDTCDNYHYEQKSYDEIDDKDFIGCLRCEYSKLKETNYSGKIVYFSSESTYEDFYSVKFDVPEFNYSKVYIDDTFVNDVKVRNSNFYWSADIKFELKETEFCEKVEAIEFEKCEGDYLCRENPECCLDYYSKSGELSIEWLEDKCECSNWNEDVSWDSEAEKETCSKRGISKYCNSKYCETYTCGDYIVEVIR